MKIIELLPELNIGGVERHVVDLANELCLMGHDVLVVSAGGGMESQLDNRVKVLHLPVHRKNIFTGLYSALRLAWLTRHEKWQLMHAHSRVPAWIAWWASSWVKVPFVTTAHAMYSLNAGILPFKKSGLTVCVSRAVKEYMRGWLPENVRVIYNGLPAGSVIPLKADREKTILSVGRLSHLKGLDVLIRAWAEICAENTRGYRLEIVGDGPERENLERLVRNLGISGYVSFTGYKEDIAERLSRCACYVLPSREEGMGLTLMQAVKMDVPVIASDIPAVRELAETPECLISPDDVNGWRTALENFIDGRGKVCSFHKNAILSEHEMAEKLLSLYGELCRAQ